MRYIGGTPENTNLREEEKICVTCKRNFITTHVNFRHQKYCSKKCNYVDEANKIKNREEIIALYADGIGLFKLGRRLRISQNAIKYMLLEEGIVVRSAVEQRKFLMKKGIGNWRKKIMQPCKVCGRPFYPKLNKRYCSVKCEFQDPERREELRSYSIKHLMEGKSNKSNTLIEKKVKGLLDDYGIKYVHQYRLGYWVFDFFVPKNTLIEVDGDYWHANPNLFRQLNSTQLKTIQNDKRKSEYAIKNGYVLFRFWETDIKNKWEDVKKHILMVTTNA